MSADTLIPAAAFRAAAALEGGAEPADAAATAGVPVRTLDEWRSEEWWPMVEATAREGVSDRLRGAMARIAEEATRALHERITRGNVVLDAKGNEHLVPVPARDLAVVLGIAAEKRELLTSDRTGGQRALPLTELLEALRALAQPATDVPEVTVALPTPVAR